MTILNKGHQYRHEADVLGWIYRITTNHCLNRLRAAGRRVAREQAPAANPWWEMSSVDPYGQVAARASLADLLGGLDDLDRQLVVYRFLDRMTQEEMAEVTGRSRKTIGKRLKRLEERWSQQGVKEAE